MIVYRITKTKYAHDLSGQGAKMYGGRWNPKGYPLLYTSGNISLATLEVLANNQAQILRLIAISLMYIEIPDGSISNFHPPIDYDLTKTRKYGLDFIMNAEHLILKVRSHIIHDEFNYLINPSHPHFNKVRLTKELPFSFDNRLIK